MLIPLLDAVARERSVKFWRYACIPVVGVYRVDESDSAESAACFESNKEMIELLRTEHVASVLFASFWSQFTEGRETRMEGAGQRDPYYADAAVKSSSPAEARLVFARNFERTVELVRRAGAKIWIMEQVPIYKYWVPNQLAKVLLYGGNVDEIARPLVEHLGRQAFVNAVFERLKNEDVILLDPTQYLCDETGSCHGAEGDHALYADSNHLSVYGVMKLRPLVEPIFNVEVDGAALRE
jgi:hypothetical protein